MSNELDCNGRVLDLRTPQVMGILNVTPDSFSDGGQHNTGDAAVRHAVQMCAEGAAIIDIGGESTRPGAEAVSLDEELDRVIPVIERLHQEVDVPLSIDTVKPAVMRAAITAGAGLINDVNALRAEGATETVASLGVPVCLMHMQGSPGTMQKQPAYENVTLEVKDFLQARIAACEQAGIARDRIILDPGFGFGKSLAHNLQLMRELSAFTVAGLPLLIGVSRKSMLGRILGAEPDQRLYGTIALQTLALMQGVHILRSHDVRAAVDCVKTVMAVKTGYVTD
ncbi:dihydropteroate synthase [Sulfuriflexus sp.]|uniref:dihydropteroate synthase n=1 Tax=Sulfuriflexus sp. TaxID=2015443 RepID=UPI0028CC1BEE|nr:dihydropteroate synthase [Sulfuriflexus sp.]MDT8403074.1 dihydropteroate synthase [Sulfuriflexus sp.]